MNAAQHRYNHLFTRFTILWLLFTLIILIGTFYYHWQQLHIQHQNKLIAEANKISKQFDHFVSINLELFGYLESPPDLCRNLMPKLNEKLYNNPFISAVIITNYRNELLCSTLKKSITLPKPSHYNPSFSGPYKLGEGMDESFLIQQQLGGYTIGLLVLETVVNNFIEERNQNFSEIDIYDNETKRILSRIGKTAHNYIHIRRQLKNADNIHLDFFAKQAAISNYFVMKELILNLSLLLLSLLVYLYCSHLISHRLSLTYAINDAIRSQHFHPVYQPIWNSSEDRFLGAEVLIRWETAEQEIIMPDFFIEEAERSGLIIPITWQLIERALSETAELLTAHPEFHLAFNLSAHHFRHPYFFSEFFEFCKAKTIRPQQLILELTEREFLDKDNPQIIRQMQELKKLGFSIAIDDFGTGHASINYLQHFPFNYLKIDKLFIQAIGTGAVTESLNQAIIDLANTLKLSIIAEGVETKEQYDFLLDKGVYWMQGWYFAKAMSRDELLDLIRYKAR
ncbi:Rtn protein [Legionella quinlivanii]|uniref:Rtn protein n=1 Tax=Legionella quinlivanii TaxID=45073 RepID=A0A0W0Y3I5_9GAMM|nr:EAL domain-containing protein [Legionella quinlivanii]KTD51548.1 Rtn protein [Legionella quinlivanii]SEF58639.1 EAL domain, c-di-GMP-specific phosphodiesterase class I (or its enzymatically inactive variant) [Legionella quinlivanii DSM 21216]STY10925.1 Rtn protein [Legionella quinlivanii]